MTRLATVCDALAARLRTVIPATSYPAPRTLSGNAVKAIVYGSTGTLTSKGGSSQEWLDTIRVQLLAGTADLPSSLAALDALIEPVADLFSADSVILHTLSGTVDYCTFVSYELGQIINYAGQDYYGGTLLFGVKRHRYAGDS